MKHAHALGAAVALVLFVPSRAGAQAPPAAPSLELAWSAPAGCPDHDAVLARVGRALAQPAGAAPARALSVAARVEPGPPWHLQLAIVGRDGSTSRALDDASCERLADATALMIAMAIDPDADGADASTTPSISIVSAPPPPPPARAVATPRPRVLDDEAVSAPPPRSQRARRAPALTLGAAMVADVGMLPALGAGVEARLGLALGALRLALRGDAWPARAAPDATTSVGVALVSLGVQACYVPTRGALEFRVCGALDVGDMYSVGGVAPAGQGSGAPWAATFAEVGLAWRMATWAALRLDLGPGLALARPRFVDAAPPNATVFEPSLLVGRGALALEFTL